MNKKSQWNDSLPLLQRKWKNSAIIPCERVQWTLSQNKLFWLNNFLLRMKDRSYSEMFCFVSCHVWPLNRSLLFLRKRWSMLNTYRAWFDRFFRTTQISWEGDLRELKSETISWGSWPRASLEACTLGAYCFENRSPFILDKIHACWDYISFVRLPTSEIHDFWNDSSTRSCNNSIDHIDTKIQPVVLY